MTKTMRASIAGPVAGPVAPASVRCADDFFVLLGSTRGAESPVVPAAAADASAAARLRVAAATTHAAAAAAEGPAVPAAAYVAVPANAGLRSATQAKQVVRRWTTGGRTFGSVPWSPPV